MKNVSRLLNSQTSDPRSSPTHSRHSLAATNPDNGGLVIDDAPGTQELVKNSLNACALLQLPLSIKPFLTSTNLKIRKGKQMIFIKIKKNNYLTQDKANQQAY